MIKKAFALFIISFFYLFTTAGATMCICTKQDAAVNNGEVLVISDRISRVAFSIDFDIWKRNRFPKQNLIEYYNINAEPEQEVVVSEQSKISAVSTCYYVSQTACCTDGSGKAHGSSTHFNQTAYFSAYYKNGVKYTTYLNADKVNYIVAPYGYKALGCGGLVIDLQTGKYIYVIVGDIGKATTTPFHEMSYAALQSLGYKRASGRWAPRGQFLVYIFNDFKIKENPKTLENNLDAIIEGFIEENNIDIDLLVAELINN